jgi:aspartyl aminopeptidase
MHAAHDLLRFIDDSPAPRLAAEALTDRLRARGFTALSLLDEAWSLPEGGYYVQRGATVIAFRLRGPRVRRFAAVGAHTDSPHLRLKPRPAYVTEGVLQLGVEVYGGVLWNSWLDRDLGLAGVVHTADGAEHAVRIHRPLARVPQLAVHLDRKVNDEGLKLNPQTHLAPVWGLASPGVDPAERLQALIADACGARPQDLLAWDLSLYDLTPSALGGIDGELIFAPRLDNLASCHAGLLALLEAEAGVDDTVPVLACFDHEEIGSASVDGADGTLFATVLERIVSARGGDRGAFHAAIAGSLMLSADMAHGVHPNYPDRHEPRHKPVMGGGPVLKSNHNQRYGTSVATAARLRALARAADVPLQDFVTRTDIACGSTIGPITASRLGMAVVDLGDPMWSMHSARECAATADHPRYVALLRQHLAAHAG